MNGKKIISIMMIMIILSGCTNPSTDTVVIEETKKDFIVTTTKINDFGKDITISKTGRLVGSQDITISALASGKITNLLVKEGQNVNQGDLLINLSDNIANYEQALKSAQNTLENAKLNYENNQISIEKNIKDAKLALEKNQNDFDSTKKEIDENLNKAKKDLELAGKDIDENLKKAQSDLEQTDLSSADSQARKNIEKLEKDIEKAEFDLETLKKSNEQTIDGFKKNIKLYYNNYSTLIDDVILFTDKFMGITPKYEYLNDDFEKFLGAKDPINKSNTEIEFNGIVIISEKYKGIDLNNVEIHELIEKIQQLDGDYKKLDKFVELVKNVIKDSVENEKLSRSQIDGYLATVSGYQSGISAAQSQLNGYSISVESFMKVYKDQEESTQKAIDGLKQQLSILKLNLETNNNNAQIGLNKTELAGESGLLAAQVGLSKTQIAADITIKSYEIALQNAQNNYDNIIATKDITLKTLKNNIDQAQIQYENAYSQYEKLFIKSPINGKIAKIFVDKGQDVNNGTPLIQIVNSNQTEISVSFNSDELKFIKLNDEVKFDYEGKLYTGNIVSIGSVADSNLNYTVKVGIKDNFSRIGDFVKLYFDFKGSNIVVPLNYAYVEGSGKGYIFSLSGNNFQRIPVTFGKTWFDKIEVLSELDGELEMITTDIKNYDERKFNIVIKE